jgi:hypothetical protein
MMIAGLVGVALAAPASATPSGPVTICHATASTTNPYVKITVNTSSVKEMERFFKEQGENGHGTHTGPVFDPSGGKDQPAWGDIIPAFTYVALNGVNEEAEFEFGGINAAAGASILAAGCEIPTFTYSKQETVTKTICKAPRTIENATATGALISETQYTAFTDEQKAAIDEEALESAEAAFDEKYEPYVDGACEGEFTYSNQETVTKTICKAGETINDASATGELISESQNQPFTDEQKAAVDADALASANAAFNTKYGSYSDGACPPPPPPGCVENCDPVVTEEPPAPVVEAAVVAAPEAATVAAPAPATVAVPAAATLPAAVPAGEGSDTGLPMWALAMVAAGMIGAAFAGKQLLGARK